MAIKLQDGNTPCLAATPSDPRPTVLVFDSGVGGLSVYDEALRCGENKMLTAPQAGQLKRGLVHLRVCRRGVIANFRNIH
jgi:hypothetical protein